MTPAATELPAVFGRLADGLGDQTKLSRFGLTRPGRGARVAGVLALLELADGAPRLLFVERAATLRHHAGQIAFPGGAAEPADPDLAATALREAQEEVGLVPESVVVLGTLPAVHVAVSGFDVTTVVGWWRGTHALTAPDPYEVAAVHHVPVAALVDPAARVQVRHPSGYTGPAFALDDLLIWGLTAHLVDGLLELAGWARPWDRERTAEIPARYLTDRRSLGGPDAH